MESRWSVFVWLLLLFTVVPFVELTLLLYLADQMGWLWTLTLVLVTGVLGAALARREGFVALGRIRERLDRTEPPGQEVVEAGLVFGAGLLLITPGVLTDAAGFAMLIRPVRRVAARRIIRAFAHKFTVTNITTGWPDSSPDRETFIDMEEPDEDE